MKTNIIIERVIRKMLFEQGVDTIVRNVIKPSNESTLSTAQTHGAILSAWSAFIIKSVHKRGIDATSNPDWSSSVGAAAAIRQAINKNGKAQETQYYGKTGPFNKIDVNGQPKYMYIVGPDLASRDRAVKHNVWVCNFSQLYEIAKRLDANEKKPLQYFEIIENLVDDKSTMLGNIIIFDYRDVTPWFNELKKYKLTDKPIDSAKLIPELQYLSKDTDIELSSTTDTDQIVDITDENAEQYKYTGFKGKARLSTDTRGNRIIIPINGSIGVQQEDTNIGGTFTGEFKNGVPYKGIITYDNGMEFTGELIDPYAYIDADGIRSFRYTEPPRSTTNKTADDTSSVTNNQLDGDPTSSTGTYPSKADDGTIIYTMSDTDKYVYWFENGSWYTGRKTQYEAGNVDGKRITKQVAIDKLNTAFPNEIKNAPAQTQTTTKISDYQPGDRVKFKAALGTKIPILYYNNQTKQYFEDTQMDFITSSYPVTFKKYSADRKYVLLDFGSNQKRWMLASYLKSK